MNHLLSSVLGRPERVLLLLSCVLAGAGCADLDRGQSEYCQRNPQICGDSGTVSATDAGAPDAGVPDAGAVSTPPEGTPGSVTQISASGAHTLVLRVNGSVWAFGRNTEGQLGDGSTEERSEPRQVPGIPAMEEVAAGGFHSLARSGGRVWLWGKMHPFVALQGPTEVPGLKDIIDISAGSTQAYALRQNGQVFLWGLGVDLQIIPTPTEVPGFTGIQSISAGQAHVLGLDGEGRVWAAGLNDKGQLGVAGVDKSPTALQVTRLPRIQFIAAGWRHSLAVDLDGRVWTWGENDLGQLGDGTKGNFRDEPRRVEGAPSATAVAAGRDHSLALTREKEVWAWGSDTHGQLGDGPPSQEQLSPVKAKYLTRVTAISAGFYHSLALDSQRTPWVWGGNEEGQLGLDVKASVYAPEPRPLAP